MQNYNKHDPDFQEADANAQLIAAAPELLDMAYAALHLLTADYDKNASRANCNAEYLKIADRHIVVTSLRRVIAKATNKSLPTKEE